MLTLGGWQGMECQAKVRVQNGGRAWVNPKTSLEGLCWLLNGWNEAKSTLWTFGLLKQLTDIASPDVYPPVPETAIQTFHVIIKPPLLQSTSSRLDFKLIAQWCSYLLVVLQYSSQVTSRVHALRGMRAREKLARLQGCFEELRAKPKSPESSTIANLPLRVLLRVLAQSRNSLYIKVTSQSIVTCC